MKHNPGLYWQYFFQPVLVSLIRNSLPQPLHEHWAYRFTESFSFPEDWTPALLNSAPCTAEKLGMNTNTKPSMAQGQKVSGAPHGCSPIPAFFHIPHLCTFPQPPSVLFIPEGTIKASGSVPKPPISVSFVPQQLCPWCHLEQFITSPGLLKVVLH